MQGKKFSIAILFILVLVMAFSLSACTNEDDGGGTQTPSTVSAITVDINGLTTSGFTVDTEAKTATFTIGSTSVAKALVQDSLTVSAVDAEGTFVASVQLSDITIDWGNFTDTNIAGNYPISVSYSYGDDTYSFTFTIIVVDATPVLTSITATTTTAEFAWGTAFATTGLSVSASYSAGNPKTVNLTDCTIDSSAYIATTAGTYAISVSYTEGTVTKVATYNVTVAARALVSIAASNAKTNFNFGENFSPSSLIVTATYADGGTAPVTANIDSSAYVATTAGTYTISVSYTENNVTKTATYNVTVANRVLNSIACSGNHKTTFAWGEEFSSVNLVVTATYADGGTAPVAANIDSSAYNKNASDDYIIAVSYTENNVAKTATYDVTVTARPAKVITGIAWKTNNGPTKILFQYNEAFVASGTIVVTYDWDGNDESSGATPVEVVASEDYALGGTSQFTYAGYTNVTLGTQTVTVTLKADTTKSLAYDITVKNYIVGATFANVIRGYDAVLETTTATYKKYYECYEQFDASAYRVRVTSGSCVDEVISLDEFTVSGADTSALSNSITVTLTYNGSSYIVTGESSFVVTFEIATYETYTVALTTASFAPVVKLNSSWADVLAGQAASVVGSFSEPQTVFVTEASGTTGFFLTNWNVTAANATEQTATLVYRYEAPSSVMSDATVSTKDATTTFTYTVIDYATGIAFTNGFSLADTYISSNEIDWAWDGAKVTVTYASGTTEDITLATDQALGEQSKITVSGWSWVTGDHNVTFATRADATVSFVTLCTITADMLQTISIVTNARTAYFFGESFDFTDVELSATYSSGAVKSVTANTEGLSVVGFSSSSIAPSATANYRFNGVDSANFSYSVSDYISGFEIVNEPTLVDYTKTAYDFNLTGITYRVMTASTGTWGSTLSDTSVLTIAPSAPVVTAVASGLLCTVTYDYTQNTSYSTRPTSAAALTDTFAYNVIDTVTVEWQTSPSSFYKLNASAGSWAISVISAFNGTSTLENGSTAVAISDFDTSSSTYVDSVSTPRTATFTVTYNGIEYPLTHKYSVATISSIQFQTLPSTSEFNYFDGAETLSKKEILASAVILVSYECSATNGLTADTMTIDSMTTEDVSSIFSIDNFDRSVIGTNFTAYVRYEGKTATFLFSVLDYVSGFTVDTQPVTYIYHKGDTIDFAGMTFTINYISGATVNGSIADLSAPDFDTTTGAGDKTAAVISTSLNMTVFTYSYTVEDRLSLEIANSPNLIFVKNDIATLEGGSFTVKWDFATATAVLSMTNPAVTCFIDTSATGNNLSATINVADASVEIENSIYTVSGTANVYYSVVDVDSVGFDTLPTSSELQYSISTDIKQVLAGAVIRVTFTDPDSIVDRIYTIDNMDSAEISKVFALSGLNTSVPSAVTATATITFVYGNSSYSTCSVDFQYTVVDYVTDIVLIPPTKTTYHKGDSLDLTDCTVAKNYAFAGIGDATELTTLIDAEVAVLTNGFDSQTLGEKQMSVTAYGFSETFSVFVVDAVSSIELLTQPTTTMYYIGDLFDMTGIKFRVDFDFRDSMTVNATETQDEFSLSYNFNTASASSPVVFTYLSNTSLTVTVYVRVVERTATGITIGTLPKTAYYLNDAADYTSGVLNVSYNVGDDGIVNVWNGSENALTDGVTVSGFDSSAVGSVEITVNFAGFSATYNISVTRQLVSIEIGTQPVKKYGVNATELDLTGATLTLSYADSDETDSVPLSSAQIIHQISFMEPKDYTVAVIYSSLATSFTVTVASPVITVMRLATESDTDANNDHATLFYELTYNWNAEFDTSNLCLYVEYDYATNLQMSPTFIYAWDFSYSGITVTCAEYEKTSADNLEHTYMVTVAEANGFSFTYDVTRARRPFYLDGIAVAESSTHLTTFDVSDAFSSDGLVINAKYVFVDDNTVVSHYSILAVSDYTVHPVELTEAGKVNVSISGENEYSSFNTSYEITVTDGSITRIGWNTEPPETLTAYYGLTLNEFVSDSSLNICAYTSEDTALYYISASPEVFSSNWASVVTVNSIGTSVTVRVTLNGNPLVYFEFSVSIIPTTLVWYTTPSAYSETIYTGETQFTSHYLIDSEYSAARLQLVDDESNVVKEVDLSAVTTNWATITASAGSNKVLTVTFAGLSLDTDAIITVVDDTVTTVSISRYIMESGPVAGNALNADTGTLEIQFISGKVEYVSTALAIAVLKNAEGSEFDTTNLVAGDYQLYFIYKGIETSDSQPISVQTLVVISFSISNYSALQTVFYLNEILSIYEVEISYSTNVDYNTTLVAQINVDYTVECNDFDSSKYDSFQVNINGVTGTIFEDFSCNYTVYCTGTEASTNIESIFVSSSTVYKNAVEVGANAYTVELPSAGTYNINLNLSDSYATVTMNYLGLTLVGTEIYFDCITSITVSIRVESRNASADYTLTIVPLVSKFNYIRVGGVELTLPSEDTTICYYYDVDDYNVSVTTSVSNGYVSMIGNTMSSSLTVVPTYYYRNNYCLTVSVGVNMGNSFTPTEQFLIFFIPKAPLSALSVNGVSATYGKDGSFAITLNTFSPTATIVANAISGYTTTVKQFGAAVSGAVTIGFGNNYFTVESVNDATGAITVNELCIRLPESLAVMFTYDVSEIYSGTLDYILTNFDEPINTTFETGIHHKFELATDWTFVSLAKNGIVIEGAELTSEGGQVITFSEDSYNVYTLVLSYGGVNYNLEFYVRSSQQTLTIENCKQGEPALMHGISQELVGDIYSGYYAVLPAEYFGQEYTEFDINSLNTCHMNNCISMVSFDAATETFTVTVKDDYDCILTVYTVKIYREGTLSADASLTLLINGEEVPFTQRDGSTTEFDAAYTTVKSDSDKRIDFITDAFAYVTVNDPNSVIDNNSSLRVKYSGDSSVIISVTSGDGTTSYNYNLSISVEEVKLMDINLQTNAGIMANSIYDTENDMPFITDGTSEYVLLVKELYLGYALSETNGTYSLELLLTNYGYAATAIVGSGIYDYDTMSSVSFNWNESVQISVTRIDGVLTACFYVYVDLHHVTQFKICFLSDIFGVPGDTSFCSEGEENSPFNTFNADGNNSYSHTIDLNYDSDGIVRVETDENGTRYYVNFFLIAYNYTLYIGETQLSPDASDLSGMTYEINSCDTLYDAAANTLTLVITAVLGETTYTFTYTFANVFSSNASLEEDRITVSDDSLNSTNVYFTESEGIYTAATDVTTGVSYLLDYTLLDGSATVTLDTSCSAFAYFDSENMILCITGSAGSYNLTFTVTPPRGSDYAKTYTVTFNASDVSPRILALSIVSTEDNTTVLAVLPFHDSAAVPSNRFTSNEAEMKCTAFAEYTEYAAAATFSEGTPATVQISLTSEMSMLLFSSIPDFANQSAGEISTTSPTTLTVQLVDDVPCIRFYVVIGSSEEDWANYITFYVYLNAAE